MRLISKNEVDEVQLAMVAKRIETMARKRWMLSPVGIALPMLVLIGDHALWRRVIIGTGVVLGIVRFISDRVQPKRPFVLFGTRTLGLDGAVARALVMAAPLLASGGFDSPILPFILPVCFFVGTLTPRRVSTAFAAGYVLLLLMVGLISSYGIIPDLVPAVFGGGSGRPASRALLHTKMVGFIAAALWSVAVSGLVRDVFRQMIGDALDARDEVLENHEAHARELTALTGELAHELKNPLANLKGLAVLVSRDVHGKGMERLQVLQHEIGRMEETLQSFLTFSRPLSPLRLEQVDLTELCESVLALHEGMAHDKEVPLTLSASGPVPVSCDARKVKQILINLVQNALEASPPGAIVELAVSSTADGNTSVQVRDSGPGISARVRAHLFEAGTTTKERGTGLGLALARALARQHGGELSLENRNSGGCAATLVLPVNAAQAPVGDVG